MTTIRVQAFTHHGAVRTHNEDTIGLPDRILEGSLESTVHATFGLERPLVIAVADGMGGHAAGEFASKHTAQRLMVLQDRLLDEASIVEALQVINLELFEQMKTSPELSGMGTTIAGICLTSDQVRVFNIGDSRVYRQRNAYLRLLSTDDQASQWGSVAARSSSVLLQALGGQADWVECDPHIASSSLETQRLLLCSDGLTDMVEIDLLEQTMQSDASDLAQVLFDQAMTGGGKDNISVIVVDIDCNPSQTEILESFGTVKVDALENSDS